MFGNDGWHGEEGRRRLIEANRIMAGAAQARQSWEYSLARVLQAYPELWVACQEGLAAELPADGA